MQTQQLTVNQQDRSHEVERSEEAAIAGEIASRLLQLREISSADRATTLISKLHALSLISPSTFWLVCTLMSGDLTEITRSYSEIGKQQGKSKQAVEQERSRALTKIQIHFPHLAKAIIELRHITSEIK